MSQTVGVAIIVYDERKTIRKCIESIAPYVDQIVVVGQEGTSNHTIKQIQRASKKVEYYNYGKWGDDFAAKRNFSFSKLKTDWLFWIDADDEVYQAENLKKLANEAADDIGAL